MSIELVNVSFRYHDSMVLNDISLKLDEPGLICIIGPNGVGKSTLIKCMNKLLRPESGRILLDGKDITTMSQKEVADHIGYVAASTSDCFSMSVIDAVLLGRHNKRKWRTRPEDIELVHRTLKMLDLEEFAMRGFDQLSAGQHQRVAIARGLVQETDILLLDEPTSNLDVMHQVYVTQVLKSISEKTGKLIIMICHDLNIAARYSDKLIVMAPPGIIDSIGTPEEIITQEMVSRIYGIECDVIDSDGAPQVILKTTFAGD